MEAQVGERAGRVGGRQLAPGVVAEDQRGAAIGKQLVDRRLEPARVAELEAVVGRRQDGERRRQELVVALEALR